VFKLIGRLIGVAAIAGIVFLALSLWQGGKPFRWFGRQSEQAGELVRKKSYQFAEDADKIKKKTDNVTDTTKKMTEDIRKVGEKIRFIAGAKDNE
jgi:hypothetical protein